MTRLSDALRFTLLPLGITVACMAAVAAQQPAAGAPPDRAAAERRAAELNARPDTAGTGRYAAMKEEAASLPRHVIYRPRDLAALGSLKRYWRFYNRARPHQSLDYRTPAAVYFGDEKASEPKSRREVARA